ncbi:MAG: hypothetical protein LBE75_08170 [Burkholderiales bacterium]|jgi:hypothetical protein|nr:hypothetical protein [Burkholderiales bacterium]
MTPALRMGWTLAANLATIVPFAYSLVNRINLPALLASPCRTELYGLRFTASSEQGCSPL